MKSPKAKRLLDGKVNLRTRKRQKVSKEGRGSSKDVIGHRQTGRQFTSLNELKWKEVAMPEGLDDVEGFFGLEEIEGVDIVRSDQGKIEYRLAGRSHETNEDSASESNGDIQVLGDIENSEWLGFDDDPPGPASGTVVESANENHGTPKVNILKAKRMGEKQKQKPKKGGVTDSLHISRNGHDPVQPFNGFADLENEHDEKEADVSAWKTLDLSSDTLSALSKLGFSRPTPIQSSAIPEILDGHDVIGKASTGSGKTLAFGIPILEHYLEAHANKPVRAQSRVGVDSLQYPPTALILSPTRELAIQLSAHLTALCSNPAWNGPSIATLTGGLSLQKQQRLLAHADIIVGTPGRLWEVISEDLSSAKWLKRIKFLVVDEADRLLSEGHFKEFEEILNALERRDDDGGGGGEASDDGDADGEHVYRQTLVFSATFNKGLQRKLAGKAKPTGSELMGKKESMEYLLKRLNFREPKPKFIDVNPVSQMAEGLKEGLVECAGTEKDLYLYTLLLYYPNFRTLIFTNSIASVRRLTPFLQNLNLPALALHSEMPQKARLRSVERFSSPSNPGSILIATDIAARGLDIQGVQLIVHYHLPRAADMYVHRSGRTARADSSGSSVLLCAPEEVAGVRRLIARVHANAPSSNSRYFMRSLEVDRRIASRLKPRVTLAKKIADSTLAKEKKGHTDEWLRNAAKELGVEYDSEEFENAQGSRKGRGSGRLKAERQARSLSKAEVAALKAELKNMLTTRVNVGVSESYLTSGSVDIQQLLEGRKGEFLGSVEGLGFEDR